MYNQTVVNFARHYFAFPWNTNGNNFMKKLYLRLRPTTFGDLGNFVHTSTVADKLAEEIKELIDDEDCEIEINKNDDADNYTIKLKFPNGTLVIKYATNKKGYGSVGTGIAQLSIEGCNDKSLTPFCQKLEKENFFKTRPDTTAAADKIRTAINKLSGHSVLAAASDD